MRTALILAAVAAFLGACSGGSSGCGGDQKESSSSAPQSSGGGGSAGGGGGEAVSFQRTAMGPRSADGNVVKSTATAGTAASAPAAPSGAAGGVASTAAAKAASKAAAPDSQSVLCAGFPGLPDDCMESPQLVDVQKKCCPTGIVFACRAVPGGARLTARGCATPPP
jgi:hypothetical protein